MKFYNTAKYGVVGLTEAPRLELAPMNIGTTVLCPGPVATDIIARTRQLQPRLDDALPVVSAPPPSIDQGA